MGGCHLLRDRVRTAITIREALQSTGIRRSGGPRNGFRYRRVRGGAVSAAERRRITGLEVPAGWTEVFIARSPSARVQAVGVDAAGRWQYLYCTSHAARSARNKFDRVAAFAEAVPALRRALGRDLRLPGLPRDKALGCAVAVIATCFVRAGSEEYAAENGSFGLATLRRRHVTVNGDCIRFDYRGKHGLRQQHEIRNRKLARIVAAMLRLPGVEVFKYREEGDRVADVTRRQVNRYIKQVMGRQFSARDFRTWAATLICAGALARLKAPAPTGRSRRRVAAQAIRETAAHLGNTGEVCRSSYIHPAVLRAFERGEVVTHAITHPEVLIRHRGTGLDRAERALLALIQRRR